MRDLSKKTLFYPHLPGLVALPLPRFRSGRKIHGKNENTNSVVTQNHNVLFYQKQFNP